VRGKLFPGHATLLDVYIMRESLIRGGDKDVLMRHGERFASVERTLVRFKWLGSVAILMIIAVLFAVS
jgi:hypothetical protein